jgi:nitrogen fixation NifU-like protein
MQDLTDLYQSVILDHNRRPRNRGKLPTANRVAHGDNPSCGDQCSVYLRLDGDRIGEISFEGSGCAISQASASLMTLNLKGKTVRRGRGPLCRRAPARHHRQGGPEDNLSDLAALAGVHQFPARIKCATLGWHAALNAAKGDPITATTETHKD